VLTLPDDLRHNLEIARRRKEPRIGWQYPFGIAAFLLSQLLMGITVGLTNMAAYRSVDPEVLMTPWPGLFVGLLVEAAVAAALFWVMIRWLSARRVLELSLPRAGRELGAGIILGVFLISLAVGIVAALGGYQAHGFQLTTGLLVGIGIGVGAGFAEEAFFRGVLLRLLDKQLGAWWALSITSVLFGGVHITNPGAKAWGAIAIIIEAGVLLGACYLLTRRLWFAIGVHVGWNVAQSSIFSINVSGTGMGSGGLIRSSMAGPEWLTGGSVGIEGSVVSVVIGLIAGLALLFVAHRRGHLLPRVGRDAPQIDMRPGARTTGGHLNYPPPAPAPPAGGVLEGPALASDPSVGDDGSARAWRRTENHAPDPSQ
jgi:membrane protease YdiL (CAAX protease family)